VIELAFTYADFGDGKYYDLAEECRMTACAAGFGRVTRLPGGERHNLMLKRIEGLKNHMREAEGDLVYSDCDMRWLKSPEPLFDGSFDVGVMWRTGNPPMPYLACMVLLSRASEAAVHFVTEWWFTIATMPKEMQGWWGDQVALASMLGRQKPNTMVDFEGCRVRIFDSGPIIHNTAGNTAPEGVYAIHHKGQLK